MRIKLSGLRGVFVRMDEPMGFARPCPDCDMDMDDEAPWYWRAGLSKRNNGQPGTITHLCSRCMAEREMEGFKPCG